MKKLPQNKLHILKMSIYDTTFVVDYEIIKAKLQSKEEEKK